jgi:hypothetical protein
MYAPVTCYSRRITIERKRLLPAPARLRVRKGQGVEALHAVVESTLGARHLVLDIGNGLGLPPQRADQLITCQPGERVSKGDILAGPVGFSRRVVRSTENGRVVYAGKGRVILKIDDQSQQKLAGIPGIVAEIIHERGVTIRAHGALIQAAWGNGKIGQGELILLSQDSLLTQSSLLDIPAGRIVIASSCQEVEALETAARLPLGGIVLGSLHPALLTAAWHLTIPVLLIEGFGKVSLNPIVQQISCEYQGCLAAVNAEPLDIRYGNRPELFIPEEVVQAEEGEPRSLAVRMDLFTPGKKVRLIGSSLLGQAGHLVDFMGEIALENGIKAEAASVQIDDAELITVPLSNLELVV